VTARREVRVRGVRVGVRGLIAVVLACGVVTASCGSEDDAGPTPAPESSTADTVDPSPTDPPAGGGVAGPSSGEVVSVLVGEEQRAAEDDPAPLPAPPGSEPPALAESLSSATVSVVDSRTVEVKFRNNFCRAVGRTAEVTDRDGGRVLLLRLGTTQECVPDPNTAIPQAEASVSVPYVVTVELDADLPEGVVPEVQFVA
jgi:hypothetical protein